MYKLIFSLVFMGVSAVVLAQTDPTRPLIGGQQINQGAEQKKSSDIVLQSIIKTNASQSAKAIISGNLVEQGEKVFGYTVVKIEGKSVTLQSADRARELTLFTQSVVKYK